MQIWNTVEYFLYLAIFILYFKLTETVSVEVMKTSTITTSTSSTSSPLDTTESFLKNSTTIHGTARITQKRTLEECNNSFSWMCLKLEFVRILENFAARKEINLFSGISVVKDPTANEIKTSDLMAEVARNYPNDPNGRLNGYFVNKIQNILETHYLRFNLIDNRTIADARSLIETGRGDKFGKKGGMEALLAAGLMMKSAVMAMGMGAITLIAGKALITALMALTLAAVVGLKTFVGSGGKSHTYEIVTKPIYTSSHSHSVSHDDSGHGGFIGHSGASGYGGYDRTFNLNLPQNLRRSARVN